MERMMVIMIALVAIVAVGGLLYIGVYKAPQIPVIIQSPVMESGPAPGTILGQASGQIKFTVVPPSDSAGGQIQFSMK